MAEWRSPVQFASPSSDSCSREGEGAHVLALPRRCVAGEAGRSRREGSGRGGGGGEEREGRGERGGRGEGDDDCINTLPLQVMQQFPLSLQFNEQFLHTLLVHAYSSQYGKHSQSPNAPAVKIIVSVTGNFLYDTPRERVSCKLKDQTHSLW